MDILFVRTGTILTPFNPDRTPAELRYNEAHPATRVCVERTFGLLKSRYLIASYQLSPDGWIKFVLLERKIVRLRMNVKYTTLGPCAHVLAFITSIRINIERGNAGSLYSLIFK